MFWKCSCLYHYCFDADNSHIVMFNCVRCYRLVSWNAAANIRHYNNKQHHSPTRGGETMACVGGSGLEWVELREWMVCAVHVENNI